MVVSFQLGTGAAGCYADQLGRGVIGDIEHSFTWSSTGGGFTSAKFAISAWPSYDHPTLRSGTPVLLKAGPLVLGRGRINDVNRDEWTVEVAGDVTRASRFTAEAEPAGEDPVGPPTTNPMVAVEQANLRGLGWNGTGNLPNVPLTLDPEDTTPLVTIQQLLDKWCQINGKRWGLDASNSPYIADDPAVVSLLLRPGVPSIPTTSEGYLTRIVVRYVAEVYVPPGGSPEGIAQPPTKWGLAVAESDNAPLGEFEDYEDITDLGLLAATVNVDGYLVPDTITASAIAQDYADAILAARSARTSFTAGVSDIQRWHLASPGAVSPALWQPFAGRRLRHYGVHADSGQPAFGRTLEWVVGRSIYRDSDRTVTLEPVDLAARSLPKLVADATDVVKRTRRLARIQFAA